MRLVLAPKVAVVEEDTAVAEKDKVVAEEDKVVVEEGTAVTEEDKVVVEEGTAVAEEDEGVADKDQRVAVASNSRYSTYITNLSQMSLNCRYALWYLYKILLLKSTDTVNVPTPKSS
jgi:hypothetical protein